MPFRDRFDAGHRLAGRLGHLRGEDAVVLGLARGGVPVAFEVARALHQPLDVIVVRKLGLPFQPEVAMGAVGEDGALFLNPDVLRMAGVDRHELGAVEERERAEVIRRVRVLRGTRPRIPLHGRTAVVVDDGIATGATAKAACQVARAQGAARVVLAVPVASRSAVEGLSRTADEVICVEIPAWFHAVGEWYDDFTQTTDEQVIALLEQAAANQDTAASAALDDPPPDLDTEVAVGAGATTLPGRLTLPPAATGLVVFVHGSGSSRHSPRNRYVAGVLNTAGLGTLLFDLLDPHEETARANVFDIGLLTRRLLGTISWLRQLPATAELRLGLFGASTGAAAALSAAAEPGADMAAVVSRGGRPDLAGDRLSRVRAPTLLIVGGLDTTVLQLNRAAAAMLRCQHQLAVVPGATHLFEAPGTLQAAAELARDWFELHLLADRTGGSREELPGA
jgi:putative phosphoribosyl transferase